MDGGDHSFISSIQSLFLILLYLSNSYISLFARWISPRRTLGSQCNVNMLISLNTVTGSVGMCQRICIDHDLFCFKITIFSCIYRHLFIWSLQQQQPLHVVWLVYLHIYIYAQINTYSLLSPEPMSQVSLLFLRGNAATALVWAEGSKNPVKYLIVDLIHCLIKMMIMIVIDIHTSNEIRLYLPPFFHFHL
jgi:hypothetical protein